MRDREITDPRTKTYRWHRRLIAHLRSFDFMGRTRALFLIPAYCVAILGCEAEKPKMVEIKPPTVVVSQALTDDVTDYEDFTGRTDAIYSVDVRARVTGYLEKVL